MFRRSHNHMMAGFSRFDTAFHTTPTHYVRIGSQTTFQDFIPADQFLSFRLQQIAHPVDEITLQLFFILQVLSLHAGLATGTFMPETFKTFVTADMYIFIREKGGNFRQYLIHELECIILSDTKRIFIFPIELISDIHGIRGFHTGQFRVSDQRCDAMSGHVYFRNNTYITFGCIGQHFFHILLGVETAVGSLLSRLLTFTLPPLAHTGSTPGTNFRQLRQGLYFQPPSLIVRQVPVEDIHLVFGQFINILQNFFLGKPVAANIEHQPAPGELGFVSDFSTRNSPFLIFRLHSLAFNLCRKHL